MDRDERGPYKTDSRGNLLNKEGRPAYGSRSSSKGDLHGPGSRSNSRDDLYGDGDNGPFGRKGSQEDPDYGVEGRPLPMYGPDGRPLGREGKRGTIQVGPSSESKYPMLELNNIPIPSTGGEVEAAIDTPSGNRAYPFIEDNGNGTVGVSYQPNERGLHSLDVKHNGEHVQGSPYKFHASPLDDGNVHAFGPG